MIGANMKTLRQLNQRTLEEVAAALGIDPGTLSRIERGEIRNPRAEYIRAFERVFFIREGVLGVGRIIVTIK